jgi:tRNA(Ile)-lysidine synthase
MTGPGARSPAADSPPAELVARFKEALDRLLPEGGRLGLAVSGGPDSMAMLLLAEAAIPGRFEVATVDHGLRPEAEGECAFVAQVCDVREIPCRVLRVAVASGNVQKQARVARYAALTDWGVERSLGAIATAHHVDDQAETLLMRLNRGSGLAGLAGVREAYWAEHYLALIIRPLLSFRRAELASVVEAAGLDAVCDPSNDDERFDRVRIRRRLADSDWLEPRSIAQSALNLAEANEAIDYVTSSFWDQETSRDGDAIRIRLHPARAIRMRLIERAIRELGGEPRGSDISRADSRVALKRKANLAGVVVQLELSDSGPFLLFRPEPPRRTG